MAKKQSFLLKDMFYYRKRITLMSLGFAIIASLFANKFLAAPVFIFSYLASVCCLDVIVYGIKKYKESHKISAKALKAKDKMTPEQLDQFIKVMVKVRLVTFLLGLFGFYALGLMGWIFVSLYTRYMYFFWKLYRKKLVYPARYGRWKTNLQGRASYRPIEAPRTMPIQTMDNAFYAGTGVITYHNK